MRAARLAGRAEKRQNKTLSPFLGIRQLMGQWMDRRTDGGESEHTAVLGRYQRRVTHRREPFFGDDFIDLRERLTEMENAKACPEYPRRRTLITPHAWNNSARGTKGPPDTTPVGKSFRCAIVLGVAEVLSLQLFQRPGPFGLPLTAT